MNSTSRQTVLIFVLALGLTTPSYGQDWSKIQVRTFPIVDNVYALAGGGGNIGVFVGDDGVLLIDAGYTELSEKTVNAVRAVSKAPIRYVVNTHWHFDHVGGNEALAKTGAIIVGHDNVRTLMSEERFITVIDQQISPSPTVALPVITFPDSLTFNFNGDEVRVLHVESAHTSSDSIVYLKKANLVHVGDIMFNGMYPFIDVNADGSIDGLVAAHDKVLALVDDKTKIIPGHGPLADAAGVRAYRDMLATVRDRVRTMITQGKSRDEIIAAKPTKEYDAKWGQSWLDPDTWTGLVYDGMKK
ncbi:MAG: MBL fold metallo-hydrolase [Phycisphaerales bacterium]|nr:MAG: MBL fold metallo-hydrolase [Phycisphaerales bacterium]